MLLIRKSIQIRQSLIERWVSNGAVEWWGHKQNIIEVYKAASIIVYLLPRRASKVLIEAAATGRPVVTTDVPGCRDAIKPNVTGLLVKPRNSSSLAKALCV